MASRNQQLPDVLRERALTSGHKPFLQMVGGNALSYKEVYDYAGTIAGGVAALGVAKGECVVIMADNTIDSVCTWLGITLAGAVEVAINTGYRAHSLEHALQNSQARVMFIEPELLPRVHEIQESLTHLATIVVLPGAEPIERPDFQKIRVTSFRNVLDASKGIPERTIWASDLASVVYTSGTTGPAKGVMMPHGHITLFATLGLEGVRLSEDDVWYCFIPLFHVAGKFIAIYGSMIAGGKVILDTRFSADTWLQRIREYGVTVALAHGPLVEMVHKLPPLPDDADNPMTRLIASPFPAKIATDFEKRFGLRGIETWGMTEVAVPVWQPFDEATRIGSCGRARTDYFDFRVVDPDTDIEMPRGEIGEFALRPKQPWTIAQGYLRMPEATLSAWRNLWFHSGDLGYITEDGYVYFVDRAKERIRRRAENISSYEIESAALTHEDIAACAAVGVPSGLDGDDDVMLYAVRRNGADLSHPELLRYLATRLPHFMVPRYITFVDDLPRTPTGKPQKSLLRDAGVTASSWDRATAGISLRELVSG
ncbi:AMP-binding protein [Arthrobacter globiformis]|uniref:ATP-dependent acyl-CoA ligase n=1 Tax=Arthrobacter globiformis TaxID=1665 RepID=A0A328HDN9_ARTGO|nr:AMP-binding protein [Arthrobacter globiformis]RAM36736.1 ATP-dependent acyl-CoA ligase [Arthrobacter globiformis]